MEKIEKTIKKSKFVGYGYVGIWKNGEIGWCLPRFLGDKRNAGWPEPTDRNKNEPFYKCKITIEAIKDKRGLYRKNRIKKY